MMVSATTVNAITVNAMQLAAIHYQTGFRIDDFMARLETLLRADNISVGGAIQQNAAEARGAMTLVDISSGAALEISQRLGPLARGCRLDSGRLAEFGTLLEHPPLADIDLVILNKFGRAEAEGHGLRRNIEQALEAGKAVLTAVRPPYDDAWRSFHEGLAAELPPDMERVRAWCREAVQRQRDGDATVSSIQSTESA